MPETTQQRQAKGIYTKAELKKLKGEEAHRVRNKVITKVAQSNQIPDSMYKGKGSDIPITTSAPTVKKPAKPETRPAVAKLESTRKGISMAPYTQSIGSRQIDSPTNFRSSQASNLEGMNKNFSSGNRIANRASKTRGKGEDALAAGKLGKAKRLRRRYDRQTKRLNNKLK